MCRDLSFSESNLVTPVYWSTKSRSHSSGRFTSLLLRMEYFEHSCYYVLQIVVTYVKSTISVVLTTTIKIVIVVIITSDRHKLVGYRFFPPLPVPSVCTQGKLGKLISTFMTLRRIIWLFLSPPKKRICRLFTVFTLNLWLDLCL